MVNILGANSVSGGYEIDNSLRFNDGDTAELTRTPSSESDKQKHTISMWVKRCTSGVNQALFSAGASDQLVYLIRFIDDSLYIQQGSNFVKQTNRLFRDPSAWFHIVVAMDSTQSTLNDRIKIYVNGVLETSFASSTYNGGQNLNLLVNDNVIHAVGYNTLDNATPFDGYISEFHLIDGQQLAASNFGEFNDNGVWIPKAYTGAYGTNGVYLEFKETGTGTNSSGMGADTSGNDNHFAVTNLAATDVTTDTPTNNFATMNPLRMSTTNYLSGGATQGTFSEGNLKVVGAAGGTGSAAYMNESATFTMDKFYVEARIEDNSGSQIGVMDETYFGGSFGALNSTGTICVNATTIKKNNSNIFTLDSYSAGDIIGIAMNQTSQKIWFSINGDYQGSGTQNPATGDGGYDTSDVGTNMFFAIGDGGSSVSGGIANFGQEGSFAGTKTAGGNADANGHGDFFSAVPSGFYSLCTKNLGEFG